jgi:hypothetical protein
VMSPDEALDVATKLDWNEAWRAGRARARHRFDSRAFWNARGLVRGARPRVALL